MLGEVFFLSCDLGHPRHEISLDGFHRHGLFAERILQQGLFVLGDIEFLGQLVPAQSRGAHFFLQLGLQLILLGLDRIQLLPRLGLLLSLALLDLEYGIF